MNAARSLYKFCLNNFKVFPAHSEAEKLQRLPRILFWFDCKNNILSVIVQKWCYYRTALRTCYTMGSRQAELMDILFHGGLEK